MIFLNLFGIIIKMNKYFFNVIFFLMILMTNKALSNIYKFSFNNIDGTVIDLKDYKGHPILIVNTASFCGYTYQYKELQYLYTRYKSKGLKIIGIPSNDFGNQEFKNNNEVKEFCEINFNLSFDLTSITNITKKPSHPFFHWIKKSGGYLAFPKWNFYKYLISREGKFHKYFTSFTNPASKKFIKAIEEIL